MIKISLPQNQAANSFQTDKIVSVKVIEQNGNQAVIDVNGSRIHATMEADTPTSFLAFIERDGDSFKLRLLSSFKESPVYRSLTQEKVAEKVRLFFLNENIAETKESVETALKMLESGLKLDRNALRILQSAAVKFGGDFRDILVYLAQNGAVISPEFVDFLFGIRRVYRELLKDKAFTVKEDGEIVPPTQSGENENILTALFGLFGGLFKAPYEARLFRHKDGEYLTQARKQSENRIYVELSNPDMGSVLLVFDLSELKYDISVRLNEKLYREIGKKAQNGKDRLVKRLEAITLDKRVFLSINEMNDLTEFFRPDAEEKGNQLPGLDIMV